MVKNLKRQNTLKGKKNRNGEIKLTKTFKNNNFHKYKNKFSPNGSFYIISPKEIKKSKSFFTKNSIGIQLLKKKEMIDIDTMADLKLARNIK